MIGFWTNLLAFLSKTASYWGLFLGTLCLSLVLTPICRALATRLGMVDLPSARRINKTPVPRGGGLAIYLAFITVICVGADVFGLFAVPPVSMMHRLVVLSGALCLLGLLDDKFSLPPIVKLGGQVGVACGAYFWAHVSFATHYPLLPLWLDCPFTVFWIVGAINAFNLIDGLDGLATGLASIAAIGMAGALFFSGQPENTLIYFSFLGACLGFLRYNFNPATVFLGDTGSMFLGFALSTMPLAAGGSNSLFVSLGVPILAMGVPIFDTALAILRRVVRALLRRMLGSESGNTHVMEADTDHLHHRILRQFVTQRRAALILYGLALLFVAIGLGGLALKGRAVALYIIGFMVAATVLFRDMRRIELWDTGRLLNAVAREKDPVASRRHHLLRVPLRLALDVLVLIGVWIVTRLTLSLPLTEDAVRRGLAIYTIPVFLCLVAFRSYQTVWSRAQLSNYVRLVLAVVIGTGLAVATVEFAQMPHSNLFMFSCLYMALVILGLVLTRVLRAVVRDFFYALDSGHLSDMTGSVRTVVYGAGLRYRAFRRELVRSVGNDANRRVIVGILDDDVLLRNQYIGGIKIFGTLEQAPMLLPRLKADLVVVACLMTPERRADAYRILSACKIPVVEWTFEEKDFRGEEQDVKRKDNGNVLT